MKFSKTILWSLLFILSSHFMLAQKTVWKEQQDFHQVMSQTFHPAEEGDFTPIKTRSGELVEKANAWKASEIPANVEDKKLVKKTLKKLAKDSKSLDKKVKNGVSDPELKDSLVALHDTFHSIVGLCNAKDEHADHNH